MRSLTPEGIIDFRWRYERTDPNQETGNTSLDLHLADCSIQYERFPYPLQHISGFVTQRNGLWKLQHLESRDRQETGTLVTCEGQSEDQPGGLALQLEFRGTNMPLDAPYDDATSRDVTRSSTTSSGVRTTAVIRNGNDGPWGES